MPGRPRTTGAPGRAARTFLPWSNASPSARRASAPAACRSTSWHRAASPCARALPASAAASADCAALRSDALESPPSPLCLPLQRQKLAFSWADTMQSQSLPPEIPMISARLGADEPTRKIIHAHVC